MSETPIQAPEKPRRLSPVLLIFLIFPIIGIVAALAVVLSGGTGSTVPPTPAPVTLANTSLIGQSAPNFSLAALDGRTMRLSSYRGRVVFVNFWATWCEPCQRELPAFEAFMAEQGENGALVLAVNVGETAEQVTTYFDDHQISGIPALLDANLEVYDRYDVQLLPTTYVIDPAGVVRYAHLGEMTAEDLSAYVAELGAS
jgi:peroxiredoxin